MKYTAEGLHLFNHGAARVGRLVADAVSSQIPNIDILAMDGGSASCTYPNILGNSKLANTSGSTLHGATGTVANSFTVTSSDGGTLAGTVTASKVASTDQLSALPWQQVAVTGTASAVRVSQAFTANYAPGDLLTAECEFDADTDWSQVTGFRLGIQVYAGGAIEASDFACYPTSAVSMPVENTLSKVVLKTPTVLVPASGTTQVAWLLDFNGLGTFRFRRPAVRKNPLF